MPKGCCPYESVPHCAILEKEGMCIIMNLLLNSEINSSLWACHSSNIPLSGSSRLKNGRQLVNFTQTTTIWMLSILRRNIRKPLLFVAICWEPSECSMLGCNKASNSQGWGTLEMSHVLNSTKMDVKARCTQVHARISAILKFIRLHSPHMWHPGGHKMNNLHSPHYSLQIFF